MIWLLLALLSTPVKAADVTPASLDTRPAVGAAPAFQAPVASILTLSNGVSVWVLERPSLPLVSVRVVVQGGSSADPASSPGLSAFADDMLTHGAGDRDAVAFANATEQLAIGLSVSTSAGFTELALDTHADRLNTGLDLLADAILRPRFDPDEIERVRAARDGSLAESLDDPMAVARDVAWRTYFGSTHPYGHSSEGTRAANAAATPEALRASWASRSGSDHATITVVGAVTAAQVKDALEARLSGWGKAGSAPPVVTPPLPRKGPAMVLVDNPGSSQSVIFVITPAPGPHDPATPAARMAVTALGGTFTSRLNALLREEKGYTYGVGARLNLDKFASVMYIRTAVRGDVTGAALHDLQGEMKRLRKGISTAELDKARAARRTQLVEALESRDGAASALAGLVELDSRPDQWTIEQGQNNALTTGAIKKAIKSLDLKQGVIVVVGDVATVRSQLPKPDAWVIAPKEL